MAVKSLAERRVRARGEPAGRATASTSISRPMAEPNLPDTPSGPRRDPAAPRRRGRRPDVAISACASSRGWPRTTSREEPARAKGTDPGTARDPRPSPGSAAPATREARSRVLAAPPRVLASCSPRARGAWAREGLPHARRAAAGARRCLVHRPPRPEGRGARPQRIGQVDPGQAARRRRAADRRHRASRPRACPGRSASRAGSMAR